MVGRGAPADASALRSRILVIDDEPTLLKAIKRMLRGFDVTTTSRARDALAMIERGERFDVILVDVLMPDMNGMDVYVGVARCAPEQRAKIVFMTGGAITDATRTFISSADNPTLEKPFDREVLFAAVERVLALA